MVSRRWFRSTALLALAMGELGACVGAAAESARMAYDSVLNRLSALERDSDENSTPKRGRLEKARSSDDPPRAKVQRNHNEGKRKIVDDVTSIHPDHLSIRPPIHK